MTKFTYKDKCQAGLSIISHLCKLNEFKEAFNFYSNFKNEYEMIEELKSLALKNINFDNIEKLISVEPDYKGSILSGLIQSFNYEESLIDDQRKFQKIIFENKESIVNYLITTLLSEEINTNDMYNVFTKYLVHITDLIEFCGDHIKNKEFSDRSLNTLLVVLLKIDALELVPIIEVIIEKIKKTDSQSLLSAIKFNLKNDLIYLAWSKIKSLKDNEIAQLVEYAFIFNQESLAEYIVNSFNEVNIEVIKHVIFHSSKNELLNKCLKKINAKPNKKELASLIETALLKKKGLFAEILIGCARDMDQELKKLILKYPFNKYVTDNCLSNIISNDIRNKNDLLEDILRLNRSEYSDLLTSVVNACRKISLHNIRLINSNSCVFDISVLDNYIDEFLDFESDSDCKMIIENPKGFKHFINRCEEISIPFFLLSLKYEIEENIMLQIINKVNFKNFPDFIESSTMGLLLKKPLHIQELIKDKLLIFKRKLRKNRKIVLFSDI